MAGFVDSLSAPSHAAGNGTLSQFDMHDSSEDEGMQKATNTKAQDCSETREQWRNFASLLKACWTGRRLKHKSSFRPAKLAEVFLLEDFPTMQEQRFYVDSVPVVGSALIPIFPCRWFWLEEKTCRTGRHSTPALSKKQE